MLCYSRSGNGVCGVPCDGIDAVPKGHTAQGEAMRARVLSELAALPEPPSTRELAKTLGLADNAAAHHIRRLIASGLAQRSPNVHRSLRITEQGRRLLASQKEEVSSHGRT
jgi:DNA-binding MarR family transcriptional regulator